MTQESKRYSLVVGNVGTVLETDNGAAALIEFGQWKSRSKNSEGRAAGEPVTLFRDGEPWHEYLGDTHEQDWLDYCAQESFMKPVIEYSVYFECDTTIGTEVVPADLLGTLSSVEIGQVYDKEDLPEIITKIEEFTEGSIDNIVLKEGWLARLSAPGCMDCTDWSAHATVKEAQDYLMEMYP